MNDPFTSWRLPWPQNRQSALTLSSAPAWIFVALASILILLLLIVPLLTLLWRAIPGWMAGAWQAPTVAAALKLSLLTSTLATFISVVIGTPIAYMLARYRFCGLGLLDILIDLPMVLPPAVAGVALLTAFGRHGSAGQFLAALGIELPFTTAAVVVAQTFVSAPFYVRAAKAGFASVDLRLEQISATLGESALGTFRRVTLPLTRNALIGGGIMTWARSLGEFGATILFAGNLSGRTQTMPLAIYSALQSDLNVALTLAAILLLTSFALLALLRVVTR
jgi:molybdate transport system permease protein